MEKTKKTRRREGDVLKIELGDGRHSYAQVAAEPLVVFFNGAYSENLALEQVVGLPVLFRLWVMNRMRSAKTLQVGLRLADS